jgi:hypothetical protein
VDIYVLNGWADLEGVAVFRTRVTTDAKRQATARGWVSAAALPHSTTKDRPSLTSRPAREELLWCRRPTPPMGPDSGRLSAGPSAEF